MEFVGTMLSHKVVTLSACAHGCFIDMDMEMVNIASHSCETRPLSQDLLNYQDSPRHYLRSTSWSGRMTDRQTDRQIQLSTVTLAYALRVNKVRRMSLLCLNGTVTHIPK